MDRKELQIKAFAKINLTLKILRKLSNGYHQIHSVFQAVCLYDTISIFKEKKGFYLTGSVVCPSKDNLITKAKKALENFIGRNLPCKIHLIKNIPISAGLGGGSSDAAATLIGLNKLFSLGLNLKQLAKVGFQIGSDVPFFLQGRSTALVEGIGERIKPIKRKISKVYVLARPHQRINTVEIYSLFDKRGKTFFELVREICPDVKRLYDYFLPISSECGMSGTGPTIFAGFDSYGKAIKSIENFGVEKFNGDFFICEPSDKTFEII